MGIPMLKIRRSRDRLIFNMGILILVRRHLYIKTAPWWLFLPRWSKFQRFHLNLILCPAVHCNVNRMPVPTGRQRSEMCLQRSYNICTKWRKMKERIESFPIRWIEGIWIKEDKIVLRRNSIWRVQWIPHKMEVQLKKRFFNNNVISPDW